MSRASAPTPAVTRRSKWSRRRRRVLTLAAVAALGGLGLCGLLGLIPGCFDWQRNITVDGVRYTKYRTEEDARGLDRAHSIGFLESEVELHGVRFTGWLHRYDNGVVAGGTNSTAIRVGDVELPRGSWVRHDRGGKLTTCALPTNMTIQGHTCIGTGLGAAGAVVNFYESGRLRAFFSPGDVSIDSVPCAGGLFDSIGLHENGRLAHCTLSDDLSRKGQTIPAGTVVRFDENGELQATE